MLAQTIHGSAHCIPLPDKSVHAIITSPPYFGLRSYAGAQSVEWPAVDYYPMTGLEEAGMPPLHIQGCDPTCAHIWGEPIVNDTRGSDVSASTLVGPQRPDCRQTSMGQYCQRCGGWRCGLGNEPTIEMFIGHLVLCLREWWRLLRDDGCCLVNLGDSYANDGKWGGATGGKHVPGLHGDTGIGRRKLKTGLKPKDLMMIPARFALAAQADGWTLRSELVWAKGVSFLADYAGSSMPESVQDRPSKSHEYIYLLTKGPRYFWDKEAVKETGRGQTGAAANFKRTTKDHIIPDQSAAQHRLDRQDTFDAGFRSLRSVWVINPGSYPHAHFATYPEALVEPMIKATTSVRGCCPGCGAQWRRVVESGPALASDGKTCRKCGKNHGSPRGRTHDPLQSAPSAHKEQYFTNEAFVCVERTTIGWESTCTCGAGEPIPCVVLDPFVGSGTTLRVATQLNRRSIGVDISAEYLNTLVPERLAGAQIEMGF